MDPRVQDYAHSKHCGKKLQKHNQHFILIQKRLHFLVSLGYFTKWLFYSCFTAILKTSLTTAKNFHYCYSTHISSKKHPEHHSRMILHFCLNIVTSVNMLQSCTQHAQVKFNLLLLRALFPSAKFSLVRIWWLLQISRYLEGTYLRLCMNVEVINHNLNLLKTVLCKTYTFCYMQLKYYIILIMSKTVKFSLSLVF